MTKTVQPRSPHPADALGSSNTRNSIATVAKLGERASSGLPVDIGDGIAPIRMVTTQEVIGRNWRGHTVGRERLPAPAHVSSDVRSPEIWAPSLTRWRRVLRHDGHEVALVHSNGAGHAPAIRGRFVTDQYAQHVLTKCYALGWLEHPRTGGCAIAQIAMGMIDGRRMLVREIAAEDAVPCSAENGVCPHYEAERDARRARQAEKMDRLEEQAAAADPEVRIAKAVASALRAVEADKAPRKGVR